MLESGSATATRAKPAKRPKRQRRDEGTRVQRPARRRRPLRARRRPLPRAPGEGAGRGAARRVGGLAAAPARPGAGGRRPAGPARAAPRACCPSATRRCSSRRSDGEGDGVSPGRSGDFKEELRAEDVGDGPHPRRALGAAARIGLGAPGRAGDGAGGQAGRSLAWRRQQPVVSSDYTAMPLRLVTGPANAAKAGAVLGPLRDRLHEEPVLVVPSFEDVEHSQRELAERGAVFGARVLRFTWLYELIAERASYVARVASDLQRRLIVEQAVKDGRPAGAGRVGRAAGLRPRRRAVRDRAGELDGRGRRASSAPCATGRATGRAGATRTRWGRSTAATARVWTPPAWWTPTCSRGARSRRSAASRSGGAPPRSSSTGSTTSRRSSARRCACWPTAPGPT